MRGDFRSFAADENVSRKAVIIVNGIGRLGGDLQRIINGLAREIDGNAADFRTGNFNLIGFDFRLSWAKLSAQTKRLRRLGRY